MSFKRFLSKHSRELGKVATVLGAVVRAMPMDRQDRENLGQMIGDLGRAANSIGNAAEEMQEIGGIDLDRDALKNVLREVVSELLPDMMGGISEQVFRIAEQQAKKIKPKTVRAKPKAKAAPAS